MSMQPEDVKVGDVVRYKTNKGWVTARISRVIPVPSVELEIHDREYRASASFTDLEPASIEQQMEFWKEMAYRFRDERQLR